MNQQPVQSAVVQLQKYPDVPGCQKTEQLISDIMNQLMLRLGTESKQTNRQLIQDNMNKLKEIEQKLIRWKYDTLFEIQHEKLLELKYVENDIVNNKGELQSKRQETQRLMAQMKQVIQMKTTVKLLKEQKRYLDQINTNVEQIVKNMMNSKTQMQKCNQQFKQKSKLLQSELFSKRVLPTAEKLVDEMKSKTGQIINQCQDLETKTQQIQRQTQKKKERLLELKSNNGKDSVLKEPKHKFIKVEANMDYNILKIKPSAQKLGESTPVFTGYQKLQPKKQYRTEIQIYLTALVFTLLFHYVIY